MSCPRGTPAVLVADPGISASALVTCRCIATPFLSPRSAQSIAQAAGTAIHKALEDYLRGHPR